MTGHIELRNTDTFLAGLDLNLQGPDVTIMHHCHSMSFSSGIVSSLRDVKDVQLIEHMVFGKETIYRIAVVINEF